MKWCSFYHGLPGGACTRGTMGVPNLGWFSLISFSLSAYVFTLLGDTFLFGSVIQIHLPSWAKPSQLSSLLFILCTLHYVVYLIVIQCWISWLLFFLILKARIAIPIQLQCYTFVVSNLSQCKYMLPKLLWILLEI